MLNHTGIIPRCRAPATVTFSASLWCSFKNRYNHKLQEQIPTLNFRYSHIYSHYISVFLGFCQIQLNPQVSVVTLGLIPGSYCKYTRFAFIVLCSFSFLYLYTVFFMWSTGIGVIILLPSLTFVVYLSYHK